MRIKHRYLTSDSHLKIIKPVKAILDKYSNVYNYKEDLECVIPSFKYTIEFYLYEDNPNFDNLKKELSKFIQPQVTGTEYEKKDIQNAEWFIVSTGQYQYPQPENDFNYKKVTFNLDNYCPLCDIGKIQNAPFRLKTEPKQQNNQFWGLHWEYSAVFVRQEAKNILERENIKGIRFTNPILNKKDIPIDGFYQLHIDTTIDKGFDGYNTKTITCKINNEENCNTDLNSKCCGRIKFHHPKIGGYLFDKSIFKSEFDIVHSNEYFGSGASANRIQIVSRRFKDLVEKNKLKGLSFTPIVHDRLVR
ncbi:MAG: hypothetical protein U0V75_08530 [Ferruginibacter sp.]